MKKAILVAAFLLMSAVVFLPEDSEARDAPPAQTAVDSRTHLMLHWLTSGSAPQSAVELLSKPWIVMSIRFDHALSAEELSALERSGIRVKRSGGLPVQIGNIYSALVDWDSVAMLGDLPGLVKAEPSWRPVILSPLDISIPAVGADSAWKWVSPEQPPLDGTLMRIADIDTGVDYMHPAFFFADGEEFDWLDLDGDGKFDPGIDCVDLNHNGAPDTGELLNYIPTSTRTTSKLELPNGKFNPGLDWLFNDANENGKRDQGSPNFGEDSPGFGEPVFVTKGNTGKTELESGAKLVMLKTSKVRMIKAIDGTIYRRGKNLLDAPVDVNGHGTGAAATALGGQIGMRYTGVAPGAELIAIDQTGANFNFVEAYNDAKNEGADVILHEYSQWVFVDMDGTSNEDKAIDELAAAGIVHAIPAGNLTGKKKHGYAVVAAGGTASFDLGGSDSYGAAFVSLHVPNGNPANVEVTLKGDLIPVGNEVEVGEDKVWTHGAKSAGGTYRIDLYITPKTKSDIAGGAWPMIVKNVGTGAATIHVYSTDNETGWDPGFGVSPADEHYTATWPSNASGGISVASYATRYGKIGDLSSFSGIGPRIDGKSIVAIAAPGGYDLLAPGSREGNYGDIPFASYRWFGGTSGAGPHVAGAAALAKRAVPDATPAQIKEWIKAGAVRDSFTGNSLPDDRWGYGKLSITAMLDAGGYDGNLPPYTVVPDDAGVVDAGDAMIDAGDAMIDSGHASDASPDAPIDSGLGDGGTDAQVQDAGSQDAPSPPPAPSGGGCSCSAIGL